jgi:DNA-binding transcriptional regulator YhcF (GntR family)
MSVVDKVRSVLEWRKERFGAGQFISVKRLADTLSVTPKEVVAALHELIKENVTVKLKQNGYTVWKTKAFAMTTVEDAIKQTREFIRDNDWTGWPIQMIAAAPAMVYNTRIIEAFDARTYRHDGYVVTTPSSIPATNSPLSYTTTS